MSAPKGIGKFSSDLASYSTLLKSVSPELDTHRSTDIFGGELGQKCQQQHNPVRLLGGKIWELCSLCQ